MRKFVSLILSLAICISLVPTVFAVETVSADNKFTDVPANAWYLDELNYAIANGYIAGTGDTTFSPDGNLTRGQFVTILGRMLGASTADGTTKFTDVPTTSYYAPYVGWAVQNGYVNGTSDTTFAPDSVLTVEQMGTILANYISKTGAALTGYTPSAEYKDASSISQWAESSMETMRQYGMLVTDVSGNVNPTSQVTRANGAVSLVRLARGMGLGDEPTIIQPPTPQTPTQQTGVVPQLGTSLGSIIPGDLQLITRHEVDDMAAIENNVRYMLKYGLTEIVLDTSGIWVGRGFEAMSASFVYNVQIFGDFDWNVELALLDRYKYMLEQYTEFGYNSIFVDVIANGRVLKISHSGYSNEQVAKYQDDTFAVAKKVHDDMWASGKITSSMTQKEKARVYYDWIIKNCEYDYTSANNYMQLNFESTEPESWLAYGVFVNGKAVCEGYTAAYNLLLRMEGISCGTEISLRDSHGWSTVTLDGVFYHIDPTWGDTTGSPDKYFCMTEEAAWERFGGKSAGDWWDDWEIVGWW